METLFHIGMPKTGTDAIQHTMAASATYLRGNGVFYPIAPDFRMRSHGIFGCLLRPVETPPRHKKYGSTAAEGQALFAGFFGHIRGEIAAQTPALLLLSSETMFRPIPAGEARRFVATLNELGAAPRFVAYLRRPSLRYISRVQQMLKSSSQISLPIPPKNSAVLGSYAQLFGGDRVSTHLFDRAALQDGDVVADFTRRHLAPYGVDASGLTPVGDVNVSISAAAMKVLQAYRAAFHAGRDGTFSRDAIALCAALREADAVVGAPRPRLRRDIADALDYGSADPLILRDDHGIVFPDFDYRRLERGRFAAPARRPSRLEDIVEIEPQIEGALLARLATSDWARARGHSRWLAERARTETA